MSTTGSLEESYEWSEHVQHQHDPSGHIRYCKVGRLYTHATEHLSTINHGCTRSSLKPISTDSSHSSHVFSFHTVATSRSTLGLGVSALLRLVPIALVLRVLPACLSRLRHHCHTPCRDGFATQDQSFGESVCCICLGRFLHDQFSFLMFRLEPQESCLNMLETTASLSLDDSAGCCGVDAKSQLDR